jgi:hypothetical protein
MDPREAMAQVEEIREQLARAESFRAFRAASTAYTGMLALFGAAIQSHWQLNDAHSFMVLWISVAAVNVVIVGTEMKLRILSSDSILTRDATILAARQFVPCVVAGALLTLAIRRCAPEATRLLPGLWAILFSLGIFASRPGLPRAINFAGAYYMLCGLFLLATAPQGEFEAWPMPLSFGVGQLLISLILFLSSHNERNHE